MRYQETWVRGPAPGIPAQRPCADRYEVIRTICERYTRPFSVFDLGANLGYFSFRLAEDCGAICTMVDNREELLELCELNDSPNINWLARRLSADDLSLLSRCESFDVVLAMSVLHHYGNRWLDAINALCNLGHHVIAEIPALGDSGTLNAGLAEEMHDYFDGTNAEHLADFPSHKSGKPRPCYLMKGNADRITQQTIDAAKRGAPALHGVNIRATYKDAQVEIAHGGATPTKEKRPFIAGMNLWNFLLLNGTWPSKSDILSRACALLDDVCGDDLEPHNMIISGSKIKMIDQNTKEWKTSSAIDSKSACLAKIAAAQREVQ